MKTAKTLTELATELERQNDTKRDYIAPSAKITAIAECDAGQRVPAIELQGVDTFPVNNHAHGQIAGFTDIPKKYYDRMLADAPALWADNVNTWLVDEPKARMLRVLDDRLRAFVSDKFSRDLENYDLATAILPELLGKDLEFSSCEVNERSMYIKCVDKNRTRTLTEVANNLGLPVGTGVNFIDVWSPGIVIQNSEVGAGRAMVLASSYCHACTNLTVSQDIGIKKHHVGARHEVSEETYALLSDETKSKSNEAVWLQMRDIVRGSLDEQQFEGRLRTLHAATLNEICGPVTDVITKCEKTFGLTQVEGESVLEHLIRGGDLSQYGLHNAVTRSAQDNDSYDRASELERLGGRIIELPANDWQKLAA
jgi:hypothetical protein